jgi:2-polyprenyl-3-methyl-5-hydroxy-6-metoxy-1,4-benzoquinol methylase
MNSKIEYLSQPEGVSMTDDWYDLASTDHFWMFWRFERLNTLVKRGFLDISGKSILEIGCGNGIVIEQLKTKYNAQIDGCDLNKKALEKIGLIRDNIYCYNIYEKNELLKEKYDVILLFDILEHIEDDVEFLNACLYHLKPGGKIVINVPAFQHLFSLYDKMVGHLRRYSKSSMKSVLNKLDVQNIQMQYWGFILYPIVLIRKFFLLIHKKDVVENGFKPPFSLFNKAMTLLAKWEARFISSPLLGSSLMAVIEKN